MKPFPSKVLLFGEYSIMHGSSALAFPFFHFSGFWDFKSSKDNTPDFQILKLLSDLKKKEAAIWYFDFEKLEYDISKGLFFNSTIPQKSGLGSSGALTAALYENYAKEKDKDLLHLKDQLAQIESLFHGTSSGIDPLVSYTGSSLLLEDQKIAAISWKPQDLSELQFFLIDSNLKRNTDVFVSKYLQLYDDHSFKHTIHKDYIKVVSSCIDDLLSQNEMDLLKSFRLLSQLQIDLFKPMITNEIFNIWSNGLSSETYYLKLCGAGGGGFYIGCCLKKNLTKLPFHPILLK